jgi:hypothetical protein
MTMIILLHEVAPTDSRAMPRARLGIGGLRLLQHTDLDLQHLLHLGVSMDLSLVCLDLISQHVHALVACLDKLLSFREPVLMHGEHDCHISEVGRATVVVEVGDKFLSWDSHKLGLRLG